MAVNFPVDGPKFLKSIGIGFTEMMGLADAGVSYEQTAHKFTVKFPDKDRVSLACGPAFTKAACEIGLTEQTISLHAAALKAFVKDLTVKLINLGTDVSLSAQVMGDALAEVEADDLTPLEAQAELAAQGSGSSLLGLVSNAAAPTPGSDTPALDMLPGGAKTFKPVTKKKAPAESAPAISFLEVSASEMTTMEVVPLAQATRMYQPVAGTDANSRYHVVALSPAVNVAARFHGGKLSIRVAGPGLGSLSGLASNGFNTTGTHSSVHIAVGDENLMHKSLGALLLGLGVPFSSPMPQPKRLVGMGK